MAVETGYQVPSHNVVVSGQPQIIDSMKLGAGIYSGNLVIKGATDVDALIADGVNPPSGWVGFEQANIHERPDNLQSVWSTGAWAPIMSGKNFTIYANMAVGFKGNKSDLVCAFTNGNVASCEIVDGCVALKIPFGKSAAELDTGIVLPAGIEVQDCRIRVVTNVAGSSISVGILSSQSNGNATGFLNAESAVNAGLIEHVSESTTSGNITVGAFLNAATIKSADASPIYAMTKKGYITDGTAKNVSYTTSNHSIAGYILLLVNSRGMPVVGKLAQTVDATAGAAGCFVECE